MSSLGSRRKGQRVEYLIAKLIGAKKVSRAWAAGHDLELVAGDRVLKLEVKARAGGACQYTRIVCAAVRLWRDQRRPVVTEVRVER